MLIKYVDKAWLWRRAKTIEKRLLKRDGCSLTAGSIEHYLNKCIICVSADENWLEIDHDCYKSVREQLFRGVKMDGGNEGG